MDFDLFLTSPRWEILKIIAEKPSSPVEIAEKINTTVSYVSQQLKLLDAANLLSKEKTGSVEKGKPRTLFSLSKELVYLSALTKDFSNKKLIYLSDFHKSVIKIWIFTDPVYHFSIEKLLMSIEEEKNEIDGVFLEISGIPKLLIVSESKKLKQKIEGIYQNLAKKVEYVFLNKSQLKKFSPENIVVFYDPLGFLEGLKGGEMG